MRCRALAGLCWVVLLGFQPRVARDRDYVGAERCRLCHRRIYASWAKTPHQRATASIPEGRRERRCLVCHATGPQALPGVQCEACHGAGRNYWPAEIMIDREKAREAGLVEPSESLCRACHGRGGPGHSPRFSMPSAAELQRMVHAH